MKLNTFWSKMTRNAPDNPGAGGTQAADPPAEAAPDYSWMPEEYRADGQPNLDGFKTHYQDLIADQARRAEAEADVPEDGKYDFALPEDFDHGVELPEGVQVEIDTDNPLFGDLGSFLKENNMPRSAAPGLMGLLAKYEAGKAQKAFAAATKEFEALGASPAARDARVSSVQRALETKLSKDMAEALMGATHSAAGVKALEQLLMPRGVKSATTPPPGQDWENLTPMERLKRANEANMT